MRPEYISLVVAGLTLIGVVVNIVLTHRLARRRAREGLVWKADVAAWLEVEAAATQAQEILQVAASLNGPAEPAAGYLDKLEQLLGRFGRYPEVLQAIRDYLQQASYIVRVAAQGGPATEEEGDELAPDLENAFVALQQAGAEAFGAPLAPRRQRQGG